MPVHRPRDKAAMISADCADRQALVGAADVVGGRRAAIADGGGGEVRHGRGLLPAAGERCPRQVETRPAGANARLSRRPQLRAQRASPPVTGIELDVVQGQQRVRGYRPAQPHPVREPDRQQPLG